MFLPKEEEGSEMIGMLGIWPALERGHCARTKTEIEGLAYKNN